MHKTTPKRSLTLSSAVSSSISNDRKKRKLETANQLGSGSPCTNTGSHSLVNLCKGNVMLYPDAVKLGNIYF